jgi:hypothetical protein
VGLATTTLLVAGSAAALPLRGTAELQYQSTESPGLPRTEQSWVKILRVDYARRLPASLEFSSHFVFSERTLVGRLDRARTPQGTLQLAHRYFGLLTSYRPVETRDAYGMTSRQQELSLSGYAQRSGLPQISGSWTRRHHDSSPGSPPSLSVTRSLSGTYALGATSFRAGYGDQFQQIRTSSGRRTGENHFGLGSGTQFRLRRADVVMNYDFSQSRTIRSGFRSQTTRTHTASLNSGLKISKRTSSSLSYAFRHTGTQGVSATRSDEHVGALSLAHQLGPGIEASASGGVRNATVNGAIRTESYLVVGASAEGDARPGWRLGAGASHSLNWLPGQRARPIDSFRSSTRMRLGPGLDANGDLLVSTSRSQVGTAGPRRDFSLQTTAGVNAHPLRTLSLDGILSRYRAGPSLLGGGTTTTSTTSNLRLRPSSRLQLNGGLSSAWGQGITSTTRQSSIQWSPRPSLQLFASYSRARQESAGPAGPARSGQESWTGSAVMALTRDLTGTFRYTESNPGHAAHVRQVNATLVQRFGR